MSAEEDIRRALVEVESLMSRALEDVGQDSESGSALGQEGLRDGANSVLGYLRHGEAGMALEHLIYMVREPSLPISQETFCLIDRAGRTLRMPPDRWQDIRPQRSEPL